MNNFILYVCPDWVTFCFGRNEIDIQLYGEFCNKNNQICLKRVLKDDKKCKIIKLCFLRNQKDLWNKEECLDCKYRYLCLTVVHPATISEQIPDKKKLTQWLDNR